MREELRELWKFRELLITLVERELRIRYKNSSLGFAWSLLNPLVTALVMTTVFGLFLKQDVKSYGLYILAGYLPYLFFQFAIMDSAQSIYNALPIVKKVYFPREILPLAAVLSNFIHFLLALGALVIISLGVWIVYGNLPLKHTIIFVPILMIIQLALVTGLSLIISALNTFYEDVKYIVGVLLYLLFFLSPVLYFSEQVKSADVKNASLLFDLYHLNPMAALCTGYRKLLLDNAAVPDRDNPGSFLPPLDMNWGQIGVAAVISLAVLWIGYSMFNRMKWKFVERP
ncbi:MAG: ABC transporter permease [Fimbriimonadaceae bacterium]